MMAQRLIQNFRRSRGILWAGADFNAETLERTLLNLGVSLTRIEQVDLAALDHNRDIFFVDADQPISPATLLEPGTSVPTAPVVGIVGVEAPSRLKLLSEAGATAFLRKPVQAAAIYSVLFLGVNTYRRLRCLELRLAEQDRKRHGRRFVIKAVVALVQAHGISDDDAYARLRRESMRQRAGIEEFCETLFGEGSSFPAAWPQVRAVSDHSFQPGEYADASLSDAGSRHDGSHDTDDRAGRGPDQARRA